MLLSMHLWHDVLGVLYNAIPHFDVVQKKLL